MFFAGFFDTSITSWKKKKNGATMRQTSQRVKGEGRVNYLWHLFWNLAEVFGSRGLNTLARYSYSCRFFFLTGIMHYSARRLMFSCDANISCKHNLNSKKKSTIRQPTVTSLCHDAHKLGLHLRFKGCLWLTAMSKKKTNKKTTLASSFQPTLASKSLDVLEKSSGACCARRQSFNFSPLIHLLGVFFYS